MRSIVADRCSLTSAPRQEEALAADRKRDIQTSSKRALFGLYADDHVRPEADVILNRLWQPVPLGLYAMMVVE